MSTVNVFWALSALAIVAQLYGLGVFLFFTRFRRPRPERLTEFPGVTILKTVLSVADDEEHNYHAFFQQDYPGPVQLLFVASRETDPAVPLVRRFLAQYPDVDAKLVFSHTRNAYYGKIDAVHDGMPEARHDLLVLSDSDVRVDRSFARNMVAALMEPGVSLVSVPQFDYGLDTIGSGLKLVNNCDAAVLFLGFYHFSPRPAVALGHCIAFRISEFNTLGEDRWRVINTHLAEDMAYAYLFDRAGKKCVLRNVYCPVSFKGKTVLDTHKQKVRWLINQKTAVANRWVYLLGLLFYPEITAALALDWRLFLAASFTRILVALAVDAVYLHDIRPTLRYFWLVPLWDLAQVYYFALGFFKERIVYGDREYRIVNRRYLEEVKPGDGAESESPPAG